VGVNVLRLVAEESGSDLALLAGNSEVVRIDSSGNVGIGTASPANLLHIYDAANNVDIKLETGNTDGQAGFRLKNDAQEWRVRVLGTSSDAFVVRDITNSLEKFFIYPEASGNVTFLNIGNVGIGTTSPAQKLHVYGSTGNIIAQVQSVGADTNAGVIFQNDARQYQISVRGDISDALVFRDGTQRRFRYPVLKRARISCSCMIREEQQPKVPMGLL